MLPDPTNLLRELEIATPLIGFYDAPDASPFEPLVRPEPGKRACLFAFYENWLGGETVHITRDCFGCPGAAKHLCGLEVMPREGLVKFLVDGEGLKSSQELMNQWLDCIKEYKPEHSNILVGPLRENQDAFLKTVTFLVNPDQLSALIIGANYNYASGGPQPVLAPFGSGCMELVSLFEDLDVPQAVLGATDIAMRQYLPPHIMAFTVTKPLFQQLCELDEKSFLHKPFWRNLKKAREETAVNEIS